MIGGVRSMHCTTSDYARQVDCNYGNATLDESMHLAPTLSLEPTFHRRHRLNTAPGGQTISRPRRWRTGATTRSNGVVGLEGVGPRWSTSGRTRSGRRLPEICVELLLMPFPCTHTVRLEILAAAACGADQLAATGRWP